MVRRTTGMVYGSAAAAVAALLVLGADGFLSTGVKKDISTVVAPERGAPGLPQRARLFRLPEPERVEEPAGDTARAGLFTTTLQQQTGLLAAALALTAALSFAGRRVRVARRRRLGQAL